LAKRAWKPRRLLAKEVIDATELAAVLTEFPESGATSSVN
jgi:hypothetical protein